jgi:DNA gyrase inhibitor GyrI
MSEMDVRIINLEPLHVAWTLGFGASPEDLAFGVLMPWAKEKGLLEEKGKHRIFGFNNPNPSKGSPNYGYEVWIEVGPEVEGEGEIEIKDFPGGLYAVTRCVVPEGKFEVIGETWKKLVAWREDSKYKRGTHQWLEESVPLDLPDTEFVLDLYMPISA